MRFSVFALSTVPDTATTRRLFDLDDLDDQAISKVLFHRRKQQTGSSETLRWDQRAIAGMTLIRHSIDGFHIESMSLASHTEEQMLRAFYQAALKDGRLVSWDGEQVLVPLIHFRSMKESVSYPAYWEACRAGTKVHLDIRSWLSPMLEDRPTLNETARKLGYPGMLDLDDDAVCDAWLAEDYNDVRAYSDVVALNTYLIAVRLFCMTGEMPQHDGARIQRALRDWLKGIKGRHFNDFLNAWDSA